MVPGRKTAGYEAVANIYIAGRGTRARFGDSIGAAGVKAWGLLFLLTPGAQARVIEKVAVILNPGGRFLFTAPKEPLASFRASA